MDIYAMKNLSDSFRTKKAGPNQFTVQPVDEPTQKGLGFNDTMYSNNYNAINNEKQDIDNYQNNNSFMNSSAISHNTHIDSNGNIVPGAQVFNIANAIHGTRPKTDYLVVHRTEGHGFHPNDPRLTQKGVGAQITIDRKGNIYEIGDLNSKMWHAGPYNNRAIGVELTGRYLGNGQWEPLTDAQKKAWLNVGKFLVDKYKFTPNRIVNHAAIAAKSPNEGLVARNFIINSLFNRK